VSPTHTGKSRDNDVVTIEASEAKKLRGRRSCTAPSPHGPGRRRHRRPCEGRSGRPLLGRYYDPATAQFLTRDPLDALTQSAYGYVGDNPLNGVDPLGLFWGEGTIDRAAHDIRKGADAVGQGATDVGRTVYRHSAVISTVTSAAAALSYGACAFTAGVGCGLGLALSGASAALAGISTYRACFGNSGSCAGASIALGTDLATFGVGAGVAAAGESAVGVVLNEYQLDLYMSRQEGAIGAVLNVLSGVTGYLTGFIGGSHSSTSTCPSG
jgi:hypothetical protein